ncbi:histidine kinase dimerization/phosphoacceptor domain -containing protein [Rhodohalobacter mucosus]|uniref:histidine kinase n=1 Tax=Rhodohalobacter mucosus TaxID=2079485 RepID=A0A316TN67_9BACT|nr:histidine kinase dimerization/phosphoacceptor domain -containing protein [Rhodohalobacter mucosus]PWN05218.1 hypothetical protein DDZ15_15955 [Rhodohalobacter mucosus]
MANMDDMKVSDQDFPEGEGSQRLLMDTLEGIDHTEEFKSVLVDSMESTRLVMNTEASSLMLMDEETGELYVSMPTGPAKMSVAGKSIPQSKGIAGWVAENKRPYMTNDVANSEHFYGELAEDFKTRNIICVPLINRENKVIGVMQALNRRNGEEFTSRDIPVFQSLASHFTLAIERSRMIDRLHDRLQQKDAIIAEIHHRIKNNLQIISALVEDELPLIKDKHAETVLQGISLRIQSMSRLHDMLSEKNIKNTVDLKEYLSQLSDKIRDTMSSILYDVQIELDSEEIVVKQDQALLCGLILNELLINIYKHAFQYEDDEANIKMSLFLKDHIVHLRVSDNGVGLPDDFKLRKKDSIGMWIVDTLLKKLNAEMSVGSDEGTRFEIRFEA